MPCLSCCKGDQKQKQRLHKFPASGQSRRRRPSSAASDISDDEYTDYAVAGAKANNTFLSVRHLVRLVAVELLVYLVNQSLICTQFGSYGTSCRGGDDNRRTLEFVHLSVCLSLCSKWGNIKSYTLSH